IQSVAVEHLADLEHREQKFRAAADRQQSTLSMAKRWEGSGYQILRRLGSGGMASVWLAKENATNQLVAMKILRHDLQSGSESFHRFRTEVQSLQKLEHPNIVRIRSVDVHLDEPFYTMEFCIGGSLADALRNRKLRPEEAGSLIKVLADAVHVAHQAGIVHRDLKPGNVLLQTVVAPEGKQQTAEQESEEMDSISVDMPILQSYRPKLADFGLSKDLQSASRSHTAAIIGSPPYMAPEQVENSKTAGRTVDVYALGAILYECLTGQPPFQETTPLKTIQQVMSGHLVPPSQREPSIPKDLSAICIRCLEKNPAARYATAKELAHDLQRFLDGQPVHARRFTVSKQVLVGFHKLPLQLAILLAFSFAAYVVAKKQSSPVARPQEVVLLPDAERSESGQQTPALSMVGLAVESPAFGALHTSRTASDQLPASMRFTFQGQPSATASGKTTIVSDQRIIVDTSMQYELSVYASALTADGKGPDPSSVHYVGIISYDIDGHEIRPWNFMKNPDAVDTTLACDLKPGDMTISLTDASGWYDGPNANFRGLAWYGYANSHGDVYPDYTYTRNTTLGCWEEGAIDGNVIRLRVRWNGPALKAGEPVRNTWNSYQHNFRFLAPGHVAEQKQHLSAPISGENLSGKINLSKFRPGTHSIAAIALADHNKTGTQLTLSDFTVTYLPRHEEKVVGIK
ncbi:MAG: serine/threonine protein kinase, partial [bacterium]|nr:serine/threonine protein kinase [bacterium]